MTTRPRSDVLFLTLLAWWRQQIPSDRQRPRVSKWQSVDSPPTTAGVPEPFPGLEQPQRCGVFS